MNIRETRKTMEISRVNQQGPGFQEAHATRRASSCEYSITQQGNKLTIVFSAFLELSYIPTAFYPHPDEDWSYWESEGLWFWEYPKGFWEAVLLSRYTMLQFLSNEWLLISNIPQALHLLYLHCLAFGSH